MNTCYYEACESAPQHSLRAKVAAGQWQMLGAACDPHLPDVVQAVRKDKPELAGAIQVIPFAKRDWPETKPKEQQQ